MATIGTGLFDSHGRPYRDAVGEDSSGNKYVLITNSSGQLEVVLVAGTAAFGKLAANSGVDIGDVGHDITGIGHGVKVVTTAGTDVVLATSTAARLVIIQAQTDNTNVIAVGATGVDATVATGTGILLNPGDTITLPVDNLADVYIDSLVNGEGVRYTYFT